LESALAPVVSMSEVVLAALSRAAPREVQVEFGVELTAEAGAVVSKAGGGCHLTVTLTWAPGESGQDKC
jgi:Trypsin-co-occurring domain 1